MVSLPKEAAVSHTSLAQFVQAHAEHPDKHDDFTLETDRILEINLDGRVWIKAGAMIAYVGGIKFEREGLLEQGLGNLLKKAVSSEGISLSKAEGQGRLYLADAGRRVTVLALDGESIFINGNDLLALQDGLSRDIKLMRKLSAMASGGLFNVKVAGRGLVAFCTEGQPLVLKVTPEAPVFTDPQATVAWSGDLSPDFHTDLSFKTFLGRGSGDSFQMKFQGHGFVVVQPWEETPVQKG